MAERPIIFSAPMVRALLSGRKTQTRRLATSPLRRCAPGDRLWVRETCADEHPLAVQGGRYSQPGRAGIPGPPGVSYRTIYRVDGEPLQVWRTRQPDHPYFTLDGPSDEIEAKHPTVCSNYTRDGKGIHWTPSIHMPRWASRMTLIVTDVRTQKLNDISGADAIAEGLSRAPGAWWSGAEGQASPTAVGAYALLWESLHGAGSWAANPDVIAISFAIDSGAISGGGDG